ncbi:RNA-directed DNA polymerase [Thioalkalivibrio paradoxus]|nr:RNA-directed DNA polymerase [Thioalkalivibrio paradoxus]
MTAKTKSERFRRLVSHGYFAPELPPCFVSEDLARYRQSVWKAINAIPSGKTNGPPAYHRFKSEPCLFYFPRFRHDDRKHGIINPISYLAISHTIAGNFIKIRTAAKRSGISASPPVFDWRGERALVRPSVDLRDDFRVDLASRLERFAVADIRAFFHTVYTHAIPWAIHGKVWAKKNTSTSHYGNLLDLLCRNAQGGQTIGLPVGPDTSRLLAEVIASAIDLELRRRLHIKSPNASRYVDDYTIGCPPDISGETAIAAPRQSAGVYEFELNNDKSAVFPSSFRFNSGWKEAVRAHVPRKDLSKRAFQRFFYEVGRVSEEQREINVEKFALQNARSAFVFADDWGYIQSQLINAYRRNSTLVSFLAEVLILRAMQRGDVERGKLKSFIESRLAVLAGENRTGEIIWLLFSLIRLEIKLEASRIASLFELDNALVAILVNVADSRGLIRGNVDYSLWSMSLDAAGLEGPMWLYAYECVRQGVNPSGNSRFIEKHPFFGPIIAKKISFLRVESGFDSVSSVLRRRRVENRTTERLRADFDEDFGFEIVEIDDEDDGGEEEVAIY